MYFIFATNDTNTTRLHRFPSQQRVSQPGDGQAMVGIQKRLALSPRLFFKATEMNSGVFKNVSSVDNVENLVTLPVEPKKKLLKNLSQFKKSLGKYR